MQTAQIGGMTLSGPVWVDDRNPIYRRGLVTCLEAEGYAVAGESVALRPPPDLARTSLLIFDLDAVGVETALAFARRPRLLTIGLVRETPAGRVRELVGAGMSAGLALRTLTPARLVACIRAIADEGSARYGLARAAVAGGSGANAEEGHLTRRELDVLSRLADGDSTLEIAHELSYSERTVKNIVHDLRVKLHGRTRAHVVAVAARRGII